MSVDTDSPVEYGFSGPLNWLLGGAVGGIVGSLLFGGVLWLVDPTIVTELIPALYGLEPGSVGVAFHIGHGLVLGIIFGFLISREPILGALTADVATDFIAAMGPGIRFALAGFVYGLAIWAIVPMMGQIIWVSITGVPEPMFPILAFESMIGHLLYGLLLGVLFSFFVEVSQSIEETDAPFEEAEDEPETRVS